MLGSPRSGQILCLVKPASWSTDCHPLTVSSHDGKDKEALWVSLIRALIPFMRAQPSWPNHLSKALLPNTLGIRFQHINYSEDTNILFITARVARNLGPAGTVPWSAYMWPAQHDDLRVESHKRESRSCSLLTTCSGNWQRPFHCMLLVTAVTEPTQIQGDGT